METPLTKREVMAMTGGYAILPKAVLASKLSASAKLVYAALADDLGGGRSSIQLTISAIAQTAGLSRRAVQSALTEMQQEGYLQRLTTVGKSVEIMLLNPEKPVQNLHGRKIRTGAKSAPVQKMRQTSAESAQVTLINKNNKPPYPPGGEKEPENISENPRAAQLLQIWQAAYSQATGDPMPGRWRRSLAKIAASEEARVAARVKPADITAAGQRASQQDMGFGVGVVMMILRASAAKRGGAGNASEEYFAQQARREADRKQAAQQAHQLEQKQLSWFRQLEKSTCERYIDKVMNWPSRPKRVDLIEKIAAAEAWKHLRPDESQAMAAMR